LNVGLLRTLVTAELRQHLRDPLTLLFMVALPLLLYPALTAGGHRLIRHNLDAAEATVLPVATEPTFGLEDNLRRVEVADLAAAVADGTVEAAVRRTEDGAEVFWDSRRPDSLNARARLLQDLTAYRKDSQERRVDAVDVSVAADRTRRQAARWLPALLLFTLLSGGVYTALDLVTGEKERGTLETLLTTGADRRLIVLSKYLVVLLFTGVSTVLSLASSWVSAAWVMGLDLPVAVGVLAALLFVPLAVFLAAVLTASAAWAPDFKSGQVLTTPLLVVPVVLGASAAVPGLALNGLTACLPIVGLALATRDVVAGAADAAHVALAFGAAVGWAVVGLRWAADSLGREDVILGSRGSGQRRLRGDYRADALGLFALSFLALWFLGQTAQAVDLQWGMLATQVGLFVPLALAAPWWLGLPWRVLLRLESARPREWARAVAVGLLMPGVGLSVQALQAGVLQAPASLFEGLFPADVPLWRMVLLFAVLPGICEELLFRGAVMGLWRSRGSGVAAALATAVAFGVFHLSVFRFFPTFALGVVLGLLSLRARSVFPGMLAHALNNGFGMLALHYGWPVEPDWRAFVAAAGVFLLLAVG
jgi:sodium transport system permease protein